MAKMMKKWMALVIALSLMANVVSLPTAAVQTSDSDVQTVTVDLTNADGEKIGEKTTVTTTDTQESPAEYQQNVKEESDWSTQDTDITTADPVTEGNTTTEVTGNVTVDVTGQEITNDNMTVDKETGIQTIYGDADGKETVIVTDTTTTVTTTTDAQISFDTQGPETTAAEREEQGEWSELKLAEEGQWQQTGMDNNDYELDGEVTTTDHGTTDIDLPDPLDDTDVTLTMTQKNPTDSVTLTITIEEAMARQLSYADGQVLEDGSVVSHIKNANGDVIGYSIRTIQNTSSSTSAITTDSTGEMTISDYGTVTYTKPEGYTEGTEDVLDAEGNVIGTKTTEAITDVNGNIIGYNITTVTTDSGSGLPAAATQDLPAPADTWTLPQKPTAKEPETKDGLTTTQLVLDIYERGVHVGYETITRVTDEDGNEKSRESVKLYGTKTTYSSTQQATPESQEITTTTVTTIFGTHTTQSYTQEYTGSSTTVNTRYLTDEIYELVTTEDGMFMLLEGKIYQVQALSGHGQIEMKSLQPDMSIDPTKHGYISTDTDLRGAENFTVSGSLKTGYDVQYVGYGQESRIKVAQSNGSHTLAHQFVLKDADGNEHYVYCVDLNTSAIRGTSYNMANVKDSGYFTESVAKKVEGIALTGYWGTASGTGSLENLKNYMRANKNLHNLSDAEIDAITEGMALTATQAALWRYGHSATSNQMGSNVTGSVYSDSWNKSATRNPTNEEKKLVNAVYTALINGDTSKMDTSTELLNTSNFATETSLVIKEKATNSDGTTKTSKGSDGTEHDVFVADVYFTVAVKSSDLTGNLVVTLTDEAGNKLATRQLATENSNFLGKMLTQHSVEDDNVEFLIENVELPEGVKINLNLTGTQNLKEGAYLYTAEVYTTSQTFISVASGTQKVNLNVQMQFDATDPEASIQHTTNTWTEKEEDTTYYTKTNSFSRERTGTLTNEDVTVTTEVTGTIVQTDITTETTKTQRDWSESYRYELMIINDEDGGGDDDDDEIEEELLDEEVPLASAPKTGDLSLFWMIISLVCLAGAAMLSRKKTAR